MSSSLFRKEAVEHQKDRLMGDVILLQPLSFAILTTVALLIAGMIVSLLLWGTYARKETVRGYLEPDKGIVRVYPPNAGTVKEVHVEEGQEVKAGDPLATITGERQMEGGNDVDSLLLEEIDREIQEIDKRIESEKELEAAETKRLEGQITALEEELEQIDQQIRMLEERVELSKQRVEAYQQLLEQKQISQKEYDKVYEEHLALLHQQQELNRTKTAKKNALNDTKAQLETLPLQVDTKIHALKKEQSDLRQRKYEVEGRRVYVIRAPVDGTVDDLTTHEGQWVSPQAANILAIIPQDSVLYAELYVPSRAIGFIEVGQSVRIRYDAFPHQRYGVYEGKVVSISAHVIHPQEAHLVPVDIQEPVYRVIVELDTQSVTAYGKEMPLQAGMTVEADIIIERQSLLDWILDPLYSIKGKL